MDRSVWRILKTFYARKLQHKSRIDKKIAYITTLKVL